MATPPSSSVLHFAVIAPLSLLPTTAPRPPPSPQLHSGLLNLFRVSSPNSDSSPTEFQNVRPMTTYRYPS